MSAHFIRCEYISRISLHHFPVKIFEFAVKEQPIVS